MHIAEIYKYLIRFDEIWVKKILNILYFKLNLLHKIVFVYYNNYFSITQIIFTIN